MNKYAEALSASDFDPISGNMDTLVIPVLCNLAACSIQKGRCSSCYYYFNDIFFCYRLVQERRGKKNTALTYDAHTKL